MDNEPEPTLSESLSYFRQLWDGMIVYPLMEALTGIIVFILPYLEALRDWSNEENR